MRSQFIVLAKLLGLFHIYWLFGGFANLGQWVDIAMGFPSRPPGGEDILWLTSMVLGAVGVPAVFSWVLLFRTGWLADMLGLRGAGEPRNDDQGPLLRTGAKLLGIFAVALAVPQLVEFVLPDTMLTERAYADLYKLGALLSAALPFALGLLLVLRTETVVRLMNNPRDAGSPG